MAFGSFCGNCCAWFSVIGVFTFGTLAMMLYRRNPPVVEHKFHMKEGQDDMYYITAENIAAVSSL